MFIFVNPREDKSYIITTTMICSTVVLMYPMMSLVAAFLFNVMTTEIIVQWMQNIVIIKRLYLIKLSNLNRYTLFICDYIINLNFREYRFQCQIYRFQSILKLKVIIYDIL